MKAVEDGLRRLEGVDQLHTDLQQNRVTITPRQDVNLDLAAIPRRIQGSGFRAGKLWILARGELTAPESGGPAFRIQGWPDVLGLAGPATVEPGQAVWFEVIDLPDGGRLRPSLDPRLMKSGTP